jgi:acyl-coenzyme A synthetase/AMP-(fatty) acid ligase
VTRSAYLPFNFQADRGPEKSADRFQGRTVEGDKLVATATLTHDLPDAPHIVTPEEGAVVDPDDAVISWDPVMFLEYWGDPAATRAKFAGEVLLTGDLGRKDDQGYLWFVGRADDVITSAGYRIGPGEVEECLMRHPEVALAAVVGVPDPIRTEIVKAFVVPKTGSMASDVLAREIQEFVKARLAAHEYPRAIEFVDSLPMTATGKRGELKARDGSDTRH